MPWIRSSSHSNRPFWIVGTIAGIALGGLIGYETWGSTAAVVSIVEKEMVALRAQMAVIEERLGALEARIDPAGSGSERAALGRASPGAAATFHIERKDPSSKSK